MVSICLIDSTAWDSDSNWKASGPSTTLVPHDRSLAEAIPKDRFETLVT